MTFKEILNNIKDKELLKKLKKSFLGINSDQKIATTAALVTLLGLYAIKNNDQEVKYEAEEPIKNEDLITDENTAYEAINFSFLAPDMSKLKETLDISELKDVSNFIVGTGKNVAKAMENANAKTVAVLAVGTPDLLIDPLPLEESKISSNEDEMIVDSMISEDMFVNTPIDEVYLTEMQQSGFFNLSISQQHSYILQKFNINYMDLVYAMSFKEGYSSDTEGARNILAREDFEEIKAYFIKLTDNKINYVIKRRNESYDKLKVVFQTCVGESGAFNYSEGYVNMNSVHNRTESEEWNRNRYSLYQQITATTQYNIYFKGVYKKYPNLRTYPTFYGALDFLVLEENVHDYTSFRSAGSPKGEQLVPKGDKYRTPLTVRIPNPTLVDMPKVHYEIILNLTSGPRVVSYNEELDIANILGLNEDTSSTENIETPSEDVTTNENDVTLNTENNGETTEILTEESIEQDSNTKNTEEESDLEDETSDELVLGLRK